jgi:osmotically-inducible protein OsmY
MSRRQFRALAASLILAALAGCTVIEGRETAGEYIDDATISTRVRAEIVRDPDLKMRQINVETFRGEVQLTGFVDSAQQAARAAEVARSVPGVRSVRNDIVTP